MHVNLLPHTRIAAFVGAGALAFLGMSGVAVAQPVSSEGKQIVCHANSDDKKPYVINEPNKDGDVSGHADHTGPLWNDTLKADHNAWGDIIPPFDYTDGSGTHHYPGLNWSEDGQAIFANDCAIPDPVELSLSVDKTNDADGDEDFTDSETASAAGADVDFQVTITNSSDHPIVLDSLTDKVGDDAVAFDCTPSVVGTNLAAGDDVTCNATVADYSPADGDSITNDVTVTGHQGPTQSCAATNYECVTGENHGNTVSQDDDSTVTTTVPGVAPTLSLTVDKTSDADKDGDFGDDETAATAGEDVTYRVVIHNTSAIEVNLDSLVDAVDDAAATAVTCKDPLPATLAADASATCEFTMASPAAGDSTTDVATATISDPSDETSTASESDDTTVDTAAETDGGGTVTPPVDNFTGGGGTVTLPFTGAPTALLLSAAAALMALGTWLTFVGRTRKA